MTEEQKTTQQLRLESDNLGAKAMIRIIDYLFLFVAIRMVAVYFGDVDNGMFWVLAPVLIPICLIGIVILLTISIPHIVKMVKNFIKRKSEAKEALNSD